MFRIFGSREKGMVANILMNINKGQTIIKFLNLKHIELTCAPWTMKDTQVLQVDIEMLRASKRRGEMLLYMFNMILSEKCNQAMVLFSIRVQRQC